MRSAGLYFVSHANAIATNKTDTPFRKRPAATRKSGNACTVMQCMHVDFFPGHFVSIENKESGYLESQAESCEFEPRRPLHFFLEVILTGRAEMVYNGDWLINRWN